MHAGRDQASKRDLESKPGQFSPREDDSSSEDDSPREGFQIKESPCKYKVPCPAPPLNQQWAHDKRNASYVFVPQGHEADDMKTRKFKTDNGDMLQLALDDYNTVIQGRRAHCAACCTNCCAHQQRWHVA